MTNPINNLNQVIYQAPTVGQINAALSQGPVMAQAQAQKQKATEFRQALTTVSEVKNAEAGGKIKDKPRHRRKARQNAYADEPENQPPGLIDRVV